MKRKAKERLRRKKIIWERLCLSYDYNKEWVYLWGNDSGVDLTIKGYYKNDILCVVNKHVTFFFCPVNSDVPYTFFKYFILEPIIDGIKIMNFKEKMGIEKFNFKGKIGFEKIKEFEQLNNYVRIMLTRNKIQFEENDDFIYVQLN